ncbi:hypothetical protein BHM03_00038928 [Ensete ventricosum]|nr:hypothetical protein BHM03_00038928 [Ensete ventricosum]
MLNQDAQRNKVTTRSTTHRPSTPSTISRPSQLKELMKKEHRDRSVRGLCRHYDEHWSRDHRCKKGRLLMIEPIEEPKHKEENLEAEENTMEDQQLTECTTHSPGPTKHGGCYTGHPHSLQRDHHPSHHGEGCPPLAKENISPHSHDAIYIDATISDCDKMFMIRADTSGVGTGAALMQDGRSVVYIKALPSLHMRLLSYNVEILIAVEFEA